MNIFAEFHARVLNSLEEMVTKGDLPPGLDTSRVVVEAPRDRAHGDLTTNAAMVLAKPAGMPPRKIAENLKERLAADDEVASAEIAGPGFINLGLKNAAWHRVLAAAVEAGPDFGKSTIGKKEPVNVEYVSVNPTGPLHVGHGRGAVFGDALANLLETAGYNVTREYYMNDAGEQVNVLARSAYQRYLQALGDNIGEIPEGLYPGEYLIPVGKALKKRFGDSLRGKPENEWLADVKAISIEMMMDLIRDDLASLNIHHDVFFSEKSLHDGGDISKAVEDLRNRGLIYEGRLEPPKGQLPDDWEDREQTLFRATQFGDDTDRALVKSNGDYTYFAADVAYAANKHNRGFKELVFVLGADHGGYVKRLQAVTEAVSGGEAHAVVRLTQLVKLFRAGEPVKMSKRAGNFITLREAVDEVGSDVVRFVMLTRKNDAPLDFDFQKVTEQSRENPVFYVQYAHARIGSVMSNAARELGVELDEIENGNLVDVDYCGLIDPAEKSVIQRIGEYPRLIEVAASSHEPHRIAFYLYDLASEFHSLWNKGKESPQLRFILPDQMHLTMARLALLRAIRYVLRNGLEVLGVRPLNEM